jgi:hypothetical protein
MCVASAVVLVVVLGFIIHPNSDGMEKLAIAVVSSFMTLATSIITFYYSKQD